MSPADAQETAWDFRFDPSTSTLSSPASSPSPSPNRGYGRKVAVKTPLSNGWQLPSTEYKYSLSDSPFNNPFPAATASPPDDVAERSNNAPVFVASPLEQSPAIPFPDAPPSDAPDTAFPGLSSFESSHGRSTAISFNPKVTLDCGREAGLDEPVPKPARDPVDTRPRGRSLLQVLNVHDKQAPLQRPPQRAQSDSDRTNYDTETGRLLPERNPGQMVRERDWPQAGLSRHPLLQTSVNSIARDRREASEAKAERPERLASMTSDATASSDVEERATHVDPPSDVLLSPIARPFSLRHPTSLGASSAWPMPRRAAELSPRARSFNIDPSSSLRRGRRTASRRSSQASSFLSTFGGAQPEAVVDPDDEGQEVCDYVIGKQIGYGGFSVVKEAFTFEDDAQVKRAVKIVRKQIAGKSDRENERAQVDLEHEIAVWRILNHRHILSLIAVYDTPFATYCFMPLNVGGSLYELMRERRNGLSVRVAKRYAFQLASALQYLHEEVRIAHRDIKLENCLLDKSDSGTPDGTLLLCDFGMATYMTGDGGAFDRDPSPDAFDRATADRSRPPDADASAPRTSIDGSLQYASPELILGQAKQFLAAVDTWAYGVVVYALLTGKLPFQHAFLPKLQMMILKGEWSDSALRHAAGPDAETQHSIDLIKGCLEMDPAVRWDIRQVLQSYWLEGCDQTFGGDMDGGWSL
ncbi:MAG: hypothetical protein M1838_003269 [Thelocarpon superellum]|nr:MAG: hypothetical protein M1838_003269 [Thelocarpon superellum]